MPKYTLLSFKRIPNTVEGGGVLDHNTWELSFLVEKYFGLYCRFRTIKVYSHSHYATDYIEDKWRKHTLQPFPDLRVIDEITCYY